MNKLIRNIAIIGVVSVILAGAGFFVYQKYRPAAMLPTHYDYDRPETKGVVIHNDAGYLSGSDYKYLESYTQSQLGQGFAHYYVAKGDVYQFHDDRKIAWHLGPDSGNQQYIGVEVTNSYGPEVTFLENEQEAFKLTAQLLKKYNLKPSTDTIRLHREFFETECPHRSFALHGESVAAVKQYFVEQVGKYY